MWRFMEIKEMMNNYFVCHPGLDPGSTLFGKNIILYSSLSWYKEESRKIKTQILIHSYNLDGWLVELAPPINGVPTSQVGFKILCLKYKSLVASIDIVCSFDKYCKKYYHHYICVKKKYFKR